jgi:flagellar protein FlbD
MIRLIRTDGQEILLNNDWIKSIEKNSHTTITLTTGEKITVKNEIDDVITKMRAARSGQEQERKEYEEALKYGTDFPKK